MQYRLNASKIKRLNSFQPTNLL